MDLNARVSSPPPAEDKSRVFLHGAGLLDSYVNAVFVHGFKKPDAFIATEAPLPARRGIFWHMIVQKQSQTIVVMNDLAPEDVSGRPSGSAVI